MQIAKGTLESYVKKKEVSSFKVTDPSLLEPRACFVTLKKGGELRGCIGLLSPQRPLFEEVIRMTCAAASEDFRFSPVQPEELSDIEIEISVLSVLEKIHSANEIEIGQHGIVVKRGDRSGTFLPEVAVQMGWNAQEFVEMCAQEKAHLGEGFGKDIELFRFTTEKIKG
ncbi:MAG: AmmeMemoRadiSam system protein A [Candidatus Omnitrophica bacterium]|nr:AmmeMemoRadiSam system protein A [Candidatus Omnitrophota bacterium]